MILANLATSAWVVAWLYEYTAISVVLMFIALVALLRIVVTTRMEVWDAPLPIIAFNWWPICLYAGWLSVASIANTAAFLVKIDWQPAIFNEVQYTLIMIIVATIINLAMIFYRNMREFAAVGIWALVAIYFKQIDNQNSIAYTALIGAIVIALYAAYHGFKNRKTNPLYRILNS